MKYIFTLTLLLLIPVGLRAEQASYSPEPIPEPTTPQIIMEVQNDETISTKRVKAELNEMAKELEQETDVQIVIIYYVKRNKSGQALRTANQIKNFLTNKHKIESKRIVVINGGDKLAVKIRIYFVPRATIESNNGQPSDSSYILNYPINRRRTTISLKQE